MENKICKFIVICVLGLISACIQSPISEQQTSITTVSEKPIPTHMEITSKSPVLPTPELIKTTRQNIPTATKESVVLGKLMEEPLPDLLLGIDTGGRHDCKTVGNSDIWLAPYPYDQPKILVSNPEADYRFPKWSPDGKWIAYIKSRPDTRNLVWNPDKKLKGSDSVWLIRPDGSENHRISDEYLSFLDENPDGDACTSEFEIASNMSWSPDGKYLIFTYRGLQETGYYLFDIGTARIRKIINVPGRPKQIMWAQQANQFYLRGNENEYFKITINEFDQIDIKSIKMTFPEKMVSSQDYETKYFDMITSDGGNTFYVIFHGASYNNRQNEIIWSYDAVSTGWKKLSETDIYDWNRSVFLPDKVITYGKDISQEIEILNTKDLKRRSIISIDGDYRFHCFFDGTCLIYHNKAEQEWGIFVGTEKGSAIGLWGIPLNESGQTKDVQPELLLDLSTYGINFSSFSYRVDYSFSP